MKKIGEGFYYSVYDLGNCRVYKQLNSHRSMFRKLMEWYGTTWFKKIKRTILYPYYAYEVRKSLALSSLVAAVNPEMFGNPTFNKKFEYEQDKAVVLETYFKKHSLEENEQMFEHYLMLLKRLWTFGFSDSVFNFTINNGISEKTGELIYVDFNEFISDKQTVIQDIASKKWLTQATLKDFDSGPLRDYILQKMDAEITRENLEKLWKAQ